MPKSGRVGPALRKRVKPRANDRQAEPAKKCSRRL